MSYKYQPRMNNPDFRESGLAEISAAAQAGLDTAITQGVNETNIRTSVINQQKTLAKLPSEIAQAEENVRTTFLANSKELAMAPIEVRQLAIAKELDEMRLAKERIKFENGAIAAELQNLQIENQNKLVNTEAKKHFLSDNINGQPIMFNGVQYTVAGFLNAAELNPNNTKFYTDPMVEAIIRPLELSSDESIRNKVAAFRQQQKKIFEEEAIVIRNMKVNAFKQANQQNNNNTGDTPVIKVTDNMGANDATPANESDVVAGFNTGAGSNIISEDTAFVAAYKHVYKDNDGNVIPDDQLTYNQRMVKQEIENIQRKENVRIAEQNEKLRQDAINKGITNEEDINTYIINAKIQEDLNSDIKIENVKKENINLSLEKQYKAQLNNLDLLYNDKEVRDLINKFNSQSSKDFLNADIPVEEIIASRKELNAAIKNVWEKNVGYDDLSFEEKQIADSLFARSQAERTLAWIEKQKTINQSKANDLAEAERLQSGRNPTEGYVTMGSNPRVTADYLKSNVPIDIANKKTFGALNILDDEYQGQKRHWLSGMWNNIISGDDPNVSRGVYNLNKWNNPLRVHMDAEIDGRLAQINAKIANITQSGLNRNDPKYKKTLGDLQYARRLYTDLKGNISGTSWFKTMPDEVILQGTTYQIQDKIIEITKQYQKAGHARFGASYDVDQGNSLIGSLSDMLDEVYMPESIAQHEVVVENIALDKLGEWARDTIGASELLLKSTISTAGTPVAVSSDAYVAPEE
jgi:hypothetical protein